MAKDLTVTDKIKMLIQWLPILQILPMIAAAKPGRERVMEVVRLVEAVAVTTSPKMDDELVYLIKGILMTEQGGALVDFVTDKVQRSLSNEAA
jgi:hypothetical protein